MGLLFVIDELLLDLSHPIIECVLHIKILVVCSLEIESILTNIQVNQHVGNILVKEVVTEGDEHL